MRVVEVAGMYASAACISDKGAGVCECVSVCVCVCVCV